jgi:hypothetical protein
MAIMEWRLMACKAAVHTQTANLTPQRLKLDAADVVDHVSNGSKSCPVLHGEPVWHVMVTLPQIEAKTVERLTEAGYRSRAFRIWRREATGQRDHLWTPEDGAGARHVPMRIISRSRLIRTNGNIRTARRA